MTEGWTYLTNSKVWHHFREDGRSLCGKWLYFGKAEFEQGNDNSPDNCKACIKKLLTKQKKESTLKP